MEIARPKHSVLTRSASRGLLPRTITSGVPGTPRIWPSGAFPGAGA